ncbi:hypothetical protein HDU98_006478 [Podochytrium sp. JEL0797]|nr:hypothetical protein HDU98_006478 [Podochytrium sp. JEL0797]
MPFSFFPPDISSPPSAAALRAFVSSVAANPSTLSSLPKGSALQLIARINKQLASKSSEAQFCGAVCVRLLVVHCPDALFVDHAAAWCNLLLNGGVKKSSGPLFEESLLSLRCVIVKSKQFAHLQRDVATPNIQKLMVFLLQKVASAGHSHDMVVRTLSRLSNASLSPSHFVKTRTLAEYTVLASTFPSIAKPYAEKIETLCIDTLSTQNLLPRVYAQAVKALVVANRILTTAKGGNKNNEKDAISTSGRISETLFEIVKELVSVVNVNDPKHVSKIHAYELAPIEGSYAVRLIHLVERFKAFVQCHLYLLGSKGDKVDTVNPKLIMVIASMILEASGNAKAKNGQHEAIYAEKLHIVMPVLVCHINRLLGALISSLELQLIPDRDTIWFLIRKSFAYSAKSGPLRVSAYRLMTTFVEVFGTNGVDSIYLGIIEDTVSDVNALDAKTAGRSEAAVMIAATKALSAILTYATPQQVPIAPITAVFTTLVQNILALKQAGKFSNSIQLSSFSLLIKCLECHARDAFPFEWVSCGMKALLDAVSTSDAELKANLESLINSHSDVLFGYRPVFTRSHASNDETDGAHHHGNAPTKSLGYGTISTTGNTGGFMDFISSSRTDATAAAAVAVAPMTGHDEPMEGGSSLPPAAKVDVTPIHVATPVVNGGGGSGSDAKNIGSVPPPSSAPPASIATPIVAFKPTPVKPVVHAFPISDRMDLDEEEEGASVTPAVASNFAYVAPDEEDPEIVLPDIVFDEDNDDEEAEDEEEEMEAMEGGEEEEGGN